MKPTCHLFLIFFVLAAGIYTCGCGNAGGDSTSPGNLLGALSSAVDAGDETKAKAVFTKEFWNCKHWSAKHFFKQATRKKFEFEKKDVQLKGKKAVVTADVIREGKAVDQLYLYALQTDNQWWFDGLDENRNHVDHYLEDRLPARFYLSDYPGSPELEELGSKLINIANPLQKAAGDRENQASLLKGILTGDPGTIHSELRLLLNISGMTLKVAATHMVDSIKRGAIVIKDESGKEKVVINVAKEADGWKLINCITMVSEESLLRM